MEDVAAESRVIVSASDAPPRTEQSPSPPARSPSPPMRRASLEEVWGRQESPDKAKGNDNNMAIPEGEKKRVALEEEAEMAVGEDDVRPHRAKRCRLQIFDDDDETEDDELVVLQLGRTDPMSTQDDETEGEAVGRPSSLRARAVKEFRSNSLWSDDDETEDGGDNFQASDEDFVPSQQDAISLSTTVCGHDVPIDERMMHAVIAKTSKDLARSQASPAFAVARDESAARKLGSRATAIKAASDELLVQLVLEHRAGLAANGAMMQTWQLVADTLATKFVHFKSGQTAKSRFECLLGAYEDPKHVGQASLTRPIRVLLDEFTKVSADDQYQLLLRIVEEKSGGIPRIREDTIDDLLLREVLRSRPFHSKVGERTAAWNRVAARLNSTQYSCGKSCKLRVQTLLRLARSIHGDSACELTTKQHARLCLIESAMAWHSMSSQRLHHAYGESLLQVDEIVEERFAANVQLHVQDAAEIASGCNGGTNSSISELCSQQRSDDGRLSQTVEPKSSMRIARHRTERLSEVSTQHRQPKGRLLVPTVSTASPVMSRTDPERIREEQRGDIKSLLEMIKTERETHHRETSAMLDLIQQDRVDRRDEFLVMMELIKGMITRPTSLVSVKTSASAQFACQGLSLLALLARVDVRELLQAIRATWPDSDEVCQWVDACPPHSTVSLGIVGNGFGIEWYQAVVSDTDGSHWTFAPYVAIQAELKRRLQRDGDPMSVRVPVRVILVSRGGVQDQRGESQFLWDLLAIVMNDLFVLRPPSRSVFYIAEIGVHLEVDVTGGDESDTSLASLSIFAACYEDGLCRATRLSLGANRIVEEARDFRLFQCLADKHHALYEHLEELQLTLPCVRGYETNLLPAVLTMLARNRRLQRLVICVTRVANNWQRVHSELRQSPVVAAIREHDGESLPVRWKALPTRQKLAWLSVVQASAGTESMAAVHALDASVMGIHF